MNKYFNTVLLSLFTLLCCHNENINIDNLSHKSNLYGIIHGNYELNIGEFDNISLLEDSTYILKNRLERSEGNWFLSDSLLILKSNNIYSRDCVSGEETKVNTDPIYLKIRIIEINKNQMIIKLENNRKKIRAIKSK